jgi:fatty-acyl-CoA synthase
MTETSPVATVASLPSELREAPEDERYRYRVKQDFPMLFVEIRTRGEEGIARWDGESMGELEIRGPWIASAYYDPPESSEKFTEDGWLRIGDISTIDQRGYMEIKDRTKDLIKSGGEWISSVALENTLMQHEAVAEAAVIAVPTPGGRNGL